eukprot:TRINITY_DN85515_c0_g1_i1.p1 TRINITY_DN85515_c0_g1~~TRINITY_DN85515_c0_g1_i1.p1  ORF type:complete len:156 (-),score=20.94 TRINITY_DN85515_c0_g1_i1:197-664(-)
MAVCCRSIRPRLQRVARAVSLMVVLNVFFIDYLWPPRDATRATFVPGRDPQASVFQQRCCAVGKPQTTPADVAVVSKLASSKSLFFETWPVATLFASILILAAAQPAFAGRDPPRTEPLGDEWKALIAPDIAVIIVAVAFNLYNKKDSSGDGQKK